MGGFREATTGFWQLQRAQSNRTDVSYINTPKVLLINSWPLKTPDWRDSRSWTGSRQIKGKTQHSASKSSLGQSWRPHRPDQSNIYTFTRKLTEEEKVLSLVRLRTERATSPQRKLELSGRSQLQSKSVLYIHITPGNTPVTSSLTVNHKHLNMRVETSG